MGMGDKMNTKRLTAQYAILQGCYWIAYCAIYGFATVFLLHIGLKSSMVGLVVALGNIMGVILQPVFAAAADRAKRVSLQQMTAGMAIVMILSLVVMQCMNGVIIGIVLSFLIINTLLQVMQPLINSISMYYVNHGVYVDFGIGRGVGSASYAVAASFLGILIDRYYGLAIMAVGCLVFAIMLFTLLSMPVMKEVKENRKTEEENTANAQNRGGVLEFGRRYRNYMLVLLGLVLIYIENAYVNNYLINIVVSLGGDTKRMGTLMTVSAMSELPAMWSFSKLVGKWDSRKLIRFAAVMFSVKALGYLVCGSLSFLYVVQMLQMVSFALCLPSAVYYVNETMAVQDRVKGQSLLIAANTLGAVFGSLSGGVLVDVAGIRAMLAVGLGLSTIGTVIVWIFVSRKDS